MSQYNNGPSLTVMPNPFDQKAKVKRHVLREGVQQTRTPSTTTPTTGGNDKLEPNTADLRVDHNLLLLFIKKGRQCNISYQSEDPSTPIPTYRQKEEKWKNRIRQ